MNILLSPPIAFLLYIVLALGVIGVGKILAGPGNPNEMKTSLYGSGEEAPTYTAAPGYRPFILIAFFFAFLHLGMLVLGTGGLNILTGIYLVGLIFALVVLILG
jgi:NADH:ubiquinone oxidoreductase subunit 3 (subunit A)